MMTVRILLAAGVSFLAAWSSGCGSNLCSDLCKSWEAKVEDQLAIDLDCSAEHFTSAETCADCLWVFFSDYQVSSMNSQTSCQDHFGYSDLCTGVDCGGHGTCVSNGSYASCDCETGYAADGPACLAAP